MKEYKEERNMEMVRYITTENMEQVMIRIYLNSDGS